MDVSKYLNRIGYEGPLDPTAGTLRGLQLAHLTSVPFENLSIHSNQPIVLNDAALFEKIVNRRRGGFCYELNGLFSALLRELGFDVARLSARVANSEGELGPEFDHMTLLVTLGERWIADVGFGDSFLTPVKLDDRDEQSDGQRRYKIESSNDHYSLFQLEANGEWKKQYVFSLKDFEYDDYASMCEYHQTSPQSHFTEGRICTRATPHGRITLSGMRFITTENGQRQERVLNSEDEYASLLRDQFGIVMSTPNE